MAWPCECGHPASGHDPTAATFCVATRREHLTRSCICVPADSEPLDRLTPGVNGPGEEAVSVDGGTGRDRLGGGPSRRSWPRRVPGWLAAGRHWKAGAAGNWHGSGGRRMPLVVTAADSAAVYRAVARARTATGVTVEATVTPID